MHWTHRGFWLPLLAVLWLTLLLALTTLAQDFTPIDITNIPPPVNRTA